MGRQLIKPVKDEDFYVIWSSFTDAPIVWGTRKQVKKWFNKPRRGEVWLRKNKIKQMFADADEYGSENRSQFGMTWTRRGDKAERLGGSDWMVERANMKRFCEVWGEHDCSWDDFDHPDYVGILRHDASWRDD